LDDPEELAKEMITGMVSETAAKVLESKVVINLLNPVAVEVGQFLGDIAGMVRFYATDNMARIFTRWAKIREGKPPLKPEEFKRVIPMLQMASVQSDDELQERWASLLENVANDANGVLPSFGQTLAQITSAEARYLDRIWERVTAPKNYNSGKRKGRDELSYSNLIDIYDPKLRAPSPAEMRVYRDRMSPEQLKAFDEMTNFELTLHDLERLSLLEKSVKFVSGDPRHYEFGGERITIPSEDSGMKTSYALTQYGVNFILAVQPPTTPSR